MVLGRTLGLALAGTAFLAAAPAAALAQDKKAAEDRLADLEKQVQELKAAQRKGSGNAEATAAKGDKAPQEDDKKALWTDRSGKALGKAIDSIFVSMRLRARPEWSNNMFDTVPDPLDVPDLANDPTGETSEFTGGPVKRIRAPKTSVDDEGFQTYFRGFLGVGAKLKENISIYTEFSFAGTWGNVSEPYNANDDPSQVQFTSGYIDGVYSKHLRLDTRIGRFYLEYGDEYVLGNTEFAQGSMYYDGVRISRNFEQAGFMVDVFGVKLVDGFKNTSTTYDASVPSFTTRGGSPDDSIYMFGVFGNYYGLEGQTNVKGGLEPYYVVVWNAAESTGVPNGDTYDIHTAGAHWYGGRDTKGKTGIEWNIDGNAQSQRAALRWSGDARFTYNMGTLPLKPRLFGQAAYASGDHNDDPSVTNDYSHAYNPLFGDAHGRFGWADYFAFSNLMVYGAGLHLAPTENWDVGFEGRAFYAARETSDRMTVGPSSGDIGFQEGITSKRLAWEGDFVLTHKYSDNVSMEAVFSYISWRDLPGDNVQRAYLQIAVQF